MGLALMEESHRAMVARGCKEAFLEVRVGNLPAVELHKKMGYSVSRRLRSYYGDGDVANFEGSILPGREEDSHGRLLGRRIRRSLEGNCIPPEAAGGGTG